jgi:hypothetical protein
MNGFVHYLGMVQKCSVHLTLGVVAMDVIFFIRERPLDIRIFLLVRFEWKRTWGRSSSRKTLNNGMGPTLLSLCGNARREDGKTRLREALFNV